MDEVEAIAKLLGLNIERTPAGGSAPADPEAASLRGELLWSLLNQRNESAALTLIRSGAEINFDVGLASELGPPLHLAVLRGLPEVVHALLERGVNPSQSGLSGFTAIHKACRKLGQFLEDEALAVECVKALCAWGADRGPHGRFNWTPLDECEVYRAPLVREWLLWREETDRLEWSAATHSHWTRPAQRLAVELLMVGYRLAANLPDEGAHVAFVDCWRAHVLPQAMVEWRAATGHEGALLGSRGCE